MALSLDLTNEWQVIGNTQAITLFRRTGANTFDAGTPVANAFSPGYDANLVASGKIIPKTDNSWYLWAIQTIGPPPSPDNPPPKINDVIEDAAGIRWVIWRVQVQAWGDRFFIDTKQER
jgi:hypothetical protein